MKRFALALATLITCVSGQASETTVPYLDRVTGIAYYVDQATIAQTIATSPGWDRPPTPRAGISKIYPGSAVVSGAVLANWDVKTRTTPIERRHLVLIPDAASKARNPHLDNTVVLMPTSLGTRGAFRQLDIPVKPDAENSRFCLYAPEATLLLGNYIKATEGEATEGETLSAAVLYQVLAARARAEKRPCKP